MRLTTGAILFCLASGVSLIRAQSTPPPREPARGQATTDSVPDRIDAYVQGRMQKHHIPGVSVAIVQDGRVVLARGYGVANMELSVPATEHTVYQLASVTKMFTATAIMMLVEEGKLGLDDKITERLSDLPAAWREVTIRHLLNHTSGIKSYTSVRDFHKTSRKDYARREILDLVAKEPLEFAPGEKWSYCNTGYFLLGMLIEKVTGKEYGEFLDERIFKPLRMMQTRVNDLRAIIPDRAQGYEWGGKKLRNGEYVSPTQPFAAGMLVSSVSDLVKWDAALGEARLVKQSTLEQMWTPARLRKGEETAYGFGWQLDKVNGHRLVSHGGGIPGFSTEFSRFGDNKLTVIVLTNAEGGHAGALARGIAGRLVPALAQKPEQPIADADARTTERLRGMIQGVMNGEVDPELFAERSRKELVSHLKEGKDQAAHLGALKAFQLLERKANDQGVKLRYRAVFANETVNAFFDLDKAGKIAGMGFRPED